AHGISECLADVYCGIGRPRGVAAQCCLCCNYSSGAKNMKQVAIIGGGIAGLSAAYYLERARQNGAGLEWALFEKSNRVGGVIQTEHRDGLGLETGPESFLTSETEAAQLCRDLGIGDELIGSDDAQRNNYIVLNVRL